MSTHLSEIAKSRDGHEMSCNVHSSSKITLKAGKFFSDRYPRAACNMMFADLAERELYTPTSYSACPTLTGCVRLPRQSRLCEPPLTVELLRQHLVLLSPGHVRVHGLASVQSAARADLGRLGHFFEEEVVTRLQSQERMLRDVVEILVIVGVGWRVPADVCLTGFFAGQ